MLNHVLLIIIVHQTFFNVVMVLGKERTFNLFFFSIFLNELKSFLENRDSVVLETVISVIERQLNVYVKIFCMLYADDTALMTESPYGTTFTT